MPGATVARSGSRMTSSSPAAGHLLPVAYTAAPFVTDEGIEGCVVVFEDIIERKANQDRLEREAGKLEWIQHIVDALAEDRFVLYAQPIINVGDPRGQCSASCCCACACPTARSSLPGSFCPSPRSTA